MRAACGNDAHQAEAASLAKVAVDGGKHVVDRGRRCFAAAQWVEYVGLDPCGDVAQHGLGHLLLSAGKEVIEAALAEPGLLGDQAEAGAVIAMLAKDFRQRGDDILAFGDKAAHAGFL
ncbi:hypothetical protein D3C87_1721300 [compost metagenome]